MNDNNKYITALMLLPLLYSAVLVAHASPNAIDNTVYFKSQIKDDSQCSLSVKQGRLVFPAAITNPATSCPDAFAWKKFIEAIKAEFWKNWAYDAYNWPAKPYAMCAKGSKASSCCAPSNPNNPGYKNTNNPGIHCPYYPEDHLARRQQPLTVGKPAFKQHFNIPHTLKTSIIDKLDPGRVIRQEMAEVVYRNRPMWAYTFKNNLYNQEGLAKRFELTKTTINSNAPYRAIGVRIEYPIGSVMFKSDWLHEDEAKKLGLHNNKKHPYITQYMKSLVGDNDSGQFRTGLHYLVAITAASKDLPNWHWYAIEHVDNLGRCDYIGCNDSFGYNTADKVPKGYAKNYTKPRTTSDGLKSASSIFVTGKKYPSGKISNALKKIYHDLGIATQAFKNQKQPTVNNKAWLSYRLKGTQTDFVTKQGVNTVMGNSVTEGGFVNSSSCMTCHAQATINSAGQPAITSIGFSSELNLFGYRRSSNGTPKSSWFYTPGTNSLNAMQVDFVWGILFAQELAVPN